MNIKQQSGSHLSSGGKVMWVTQATSVLFNLSSCLFQYSITHYIDEWRYHHKNYIMQLWICAEVKKFTRPSTSKIWIWLRLTFSISGSAVKRMNLIEVDLLPISLTTSQHRAGVIITCTHHWAFTYSFATSSPAPQKCASPMMPSTVIKVLSTSKHTAEALRHTRFASSVSFAWDFITGIADVWTAFCSQGDLLCKILAAFVL